MLFGLENNYTNLYHYDSSLVKDFNPDNLTIINNILRTRIINLKQLINRTISIINIINNHGKISSMYNIKEKELINDLRNKLKNFKLKNKENKKPLFKNFNVILDYINLIPLKGKINFNYNNFYFNNNNLFNLLNNDTKLIFYLIDNLKRLLEYNSEFAIQNEIAYLIIKIIQLGFESYLKENNNFEIRKTDYLIMLDVPVVDENIRTIGIYNELIVNNEEENEIIKEKNYDAQEEIDAYDVDDYDQDPEDMDVDGSAEAFDTDINT